MKKAGLTLGMIVVFALCTGGIAFAWEIVRTFAYSFYSMFVAFLPFLDFLVMISISFRYSGLQMRSW